MAASKIHIVMGTIDYGESDPLRAFVDKDAASRMQADLKNLRKLPIGERYEKCPEDYQGMIGYNNYTVLTVDLIE